MGVMLQAFYWDCPRHENQEYNWWNFLKQKIQSLADAGFTAIWLPPACKAPNIDGISMGYDPYDFYDLGSIDQKGSIKTWFGSQQELQDFINEAHSRKMQVYADLVLNHTNGADAEEINELDGIKRWTKYEPGSKKFARDWTCYHPSYFERIDDRVFEGMPDLCHRNPYVYSEIMEYARWLIEEIGIDGLRYDFVKGYGTWIISAILERVYKKNGSNKFCPFGVGEYWDDDLFITNWLKETNASADNKVSAFDFPLRYRLKALCDQYGFDLRILCQNGTLINDGLALQAVTFIENHDVARGDPIINDKILAYAFILTHEGYPCIFWQDYFNYGLAMPGTANGIEALVRSHEQYAGGTTKILYCDSDLYIMQRSGNDSHSGLVFVLNNSGRWNGREVTTQWAGKEFNPIAWNGKNTINAPENKWTNGSGVSDFWAPPRGYAVYVPR
ncbi:MAG TPA: alpha-amylase domain-containing protein [Chitinophagaceae bacterium]|nr:alpha-amylase domain-containing protein [Chitinophagaceae bacterium]